MKQIEKLQIMAFLEDLDMLARRDDRDYGLPLYAGSVRDALIERTVQFIEEMTNVKTS